jgi:polysaccharide biosynthesis protein PslH
VEILWVKLGGLWPVDVGGRLRSCETIAALAPRHAITVLTTCAEGEKPGPAPAILSGCKSITTLPISVRRRDHLGFALTVARSWASSLPVDLFRWRLETLRREVARVLAKNSFDLLVADFLAAVPNLPDCPLPPVLLFEHNVEHVIWRRLAAHEFRPWRRAALEWEWRKMRRYEASAVSGAALTVAVSEPDRKALQALAPLARVRDVPTGVDVDRFHPSDAPQDPTSVVFVGAMDWYPNEDGVRWFMKGVLPRIRAQIPAATFTIVGRRPSASLIAEGAAQGVAVTGTVEDVRPWIETASLVVVPLRIGGGTRLKILEALAMKKAVVSTTVGAEGLPLLDGKHLLLADGEADFATAVVALLRDPARRTHLGEAGRQIVNTQHTWKMVASAFEASCLEVVDESGSIWSGVRGKRYGSLSRQAGS